MRLTQRINAALLVIGIIPLVLLTTYALGWFHDSVRQHSRQALESLATQVTKEVSRSLQDGSNALDFLGKHIALLNPDTPEETLKAVLLDTVHFHPILNDIYVLDPSSRVRASARYSFRGEWTQNIWFRKALGGERVISDAHAVLYPFGVVMTMAQPLRMEGKPLSGVLIGQFDLYGFNQIVGSIFDTAGQALIIDHRGYVVATSGSEDILGDFRVPEVVRLARAGQPGMVEFQNSDGAQVAAVQPVPGHPWSVVLVRPQETLGRLRQMDIALSVDDFGTGYSSLSYLQRLPLDYLKVDRSFVRFLTTNPESQAIVQAIVQLGHTLGMRVIAEGVETWEHLDQLRALGCDLYQGYYFARPLSEATAKEFIISNTVVRSET